MPSSVDQMRRKRNPIIKTKQFPKGFFKNIEDDLNFPTNYLNPRTKRRHPMSAKVVLNKSDFISLDLLNDSLDMKINLKKDEKQT